MDEIKVQIISGSHWSTWRLLHIPGL